MATMSFSSVSLTISLLTSLFLTQSHGYNAQEASDLAASVRRNQLQRQHPSADLRQARLRYILEAAAVAPNAGETAAGQGSYNLRPSSDEDQEDAAVRSAEIWRVGNGRHPYRQRYDRQRGRMLGQWPLQTISRPDWQGRNMGALVKRGDYDGLSDHMAAAEGTGDVDVMVKRELCCSLDLYCIDCKRRRKRQINNAPATTTGR